VYRTKKTGIENCGKNQSQLSNTSTSEVSWSQVRLSLPSRSRMSGTSSLTEKYDPLQVAMMEEEVILLDESDNPIGKASKKESMMNFGAGECTHCLQVTWRSTSTRACSIVHSVSSCLTRRRSSSCSNAPRRKLPSLLCGPTHAALIRFIAQESLRPRTKSVCFVSCLILVSHYPRRQARSHAQAQPGARHPI